MNATPLFRKEALEYKRDTWLGEILLVRPISFGALTLLFFVVALGVLGYLALGSYTKKARASGYLVPDQGLLKIYAQQAGAVVSLRVAEGQTVKKGDVLAVVSLERTSMQGDTQVQLARQLAARQKSLTDEETRVRQLNAAQAASDRKRLAQLSQEREQLSRAIEAQAERVRLAESLVKRNVALVREHAVSELELEQARAALLDQQTRMRDMQRGKLASEREAVALQTELSNLPNKERNEIAAIERSISELTASGVENEARRESYVLAPQDGMVTALQIDQGKQANPNLPLMSLIPAGTRLQADLYVPSRSVGFIKMGSQAQLQYQAFPYQKFGSHPGKVARISRTAVSAQELPFPAPATDVYYVITIVPDRDFVQAYGKNEPLQAGMQVDADIWLDRRTLLEWILEPLYSVAGRV